MYWTPKVAQYVFFNAGDNPWFALFANVQMHLQPLYISCSKKKKSTALLFASKGADIYSVTSHGKAVSCFLTRFLHLPPLIYRIL